MNVVALQTHAPTKMFEERSEHVYFLDPEVASTFVDCVSSHLQAHSFYPSATGSPESAHYVTTLYFDSDTQEVARACEGGAEGVRLRAREYSDHGPEFGIRREPLLWLEVKTRSGANTRKVRFSIPSQDVHTFLHDGVITEPMLQPHSWGQSADVVMHEIADLCLHTVGPLKPDCMAHYRRQAWQDADETLRITLDTELAFHRPPAHLFETGTSLSEAVVEPPIARLGHSLVEIKLRAEQPDWLRELIAEVRLEPALAGRQAFSKFVAASHAVHSI